MQLKITNASHWHLIDEGNNLLYFSGEDVSFYRYMHNTYKRFAWLRVCKISKHIIGARDHFGQETFYYSLQNNHFIFGSTLADLLIHLPKTPSLSFHLIRDCFMRIPADDPIDDPAFVNGTYYQEIFRVTPGHFLYVQNNQCREEPYWSINANTTRLNYNNDREYCEQFTVLLNEAIEKTIPKNQPIAIEFSGGMDSTTLLIACIKAKLEPALFTHIPPRTRKPTPEDHNVRCIVKQFKLKNKHYEIDDRYFNPISVFKRYATWFSGPPPNLNCVLSNSLHEALIKQGYHFLISGTGGDDCASLRFPKTILNAPNPDATLMDYQYHVLQGQLSHELRMRIEYSAVSAKKMGFNYIYPLLYPPLLEFCYSLPFEQKYKNGSMRCIMKNYLKNHINNFNYATKTGAVVPSTMQKCRNYYALGKLNHDFINLPFQYFINKTIAPDDRMILQIYAYMIKQAYHLNVTDAAPTNPVPFESIQLTKAPVL